MTSGFRFGQFKYGRQTGLFLDGNEIRVGSEPQGWTVVLSTGNGNFPIAYVEETEGRPKYFATLPEAFEIAHQMHYQLTH